MDNSIAAENSATGSPEICYCGGKSIKTIYRRRPILIVVKVNISQAGIGCVIFLFAIVQLLN